MKSYLGAVSLLLVTTACFALTGGETDRTRVLLEQKSPSRSQAAIQGATLAATDTEGSSLTLQVRDVELDPKDTEGDVYLYTLYFYDAEQDSWENYCLPDAMGVAKAIPLHGQWDATGAYLDDPSLITFACTSGVLAKCVRWGYKPWKNLKGESLRPYHQTCVRMARADYCGDGESHTRDGTVIDVYDLIGIQKPSGDAQMVFEAGWDEHGATYLNHARWFESVEEIARACPGKFSYGQLHPEASFVPEQIVEKFPTTKLFNGSLLRVDGSSAGFF